MKRDGCSLRERIKGRVGTVIVLVAWPVAVVVLSTVIYGKFYHECDCLEGDRLEMLALDYSRMECNKECPRRFAGMIKTSCQNGVREIVGEELDTLKWTGFMTEEGMSVMANSGWAFLAKVLHGSGQSEVIKIGVPSIADRHRYLDEWGGSTAITVVILTAPLLPIESSGLVVQAMKSSGGLPVIREEDIWKVIKKREREYYGYLGIPLDRLKRKLKSIDE